PQRFRKTENRVSRFAARIRKIRYGEKRAVNVVVTVDKNQSHCSLMMDSECRMLDDQGMTEEWIIRVQGVEYGPANIETLREWKVEGRLLPANEARRANVNLWTTAGEIPGLFSVEAAVELREPLVQFAHRWTVHFRVRRVLPADDLRIGGWSHGCCRAVVSVVDPASHGSADPAGLDVRSLFHQCFVLAAICRVGKRGIYRCTARESRSRAERTRPSLVSTPNMARYPHRIDLVRFCSSDHSHSAMGYASTLFQSIAGDTGPAD